MTIEVLNETDENIGLEEFAALSDYVFAQLHVGTGVDMSIIFIDPVAMEHLHVEWLGLDGPTDVMSFPMDELRPGTPGRPTTEGILGDICICPPVAAQNAAAAGHSPQEEMLLLAVHGILHLLCYDHAEPEEEKVMFDLQRKLLLTFLAQNQS